MEGDSAGASVPLAGGYRLSSPQVQAAVKQLNVDPANERFMKLVDDMLRPESLPRGWDSEFIAADSKWVFKDKHGQLHDKHPVFDYYIGAMFMDKGGYARLNQIAADRPPTAEEVKQMGLYLKIKEGEDKYLWEVAEMALSAPLPPGWEEVVEGSVHAPQLKFRNSETGVSVDEHPLDNYFRELLRRRRKELLRRKKAALKALQALVRMGGARRSMLANLVAQNKQENTAATAVEQPGGLAADYDDEGPDLDSMPAAVQSSLLTAWQGLVGSAVHMVKSMQAAHWDSNSSNSSTTAASASSTAAAGAREPATHRSGRLQLLCDRLSTALDPSAAADGDAAAALQDIEQLAEQAAAAGNDANKLAQVLAGQGIVITIGCTDSSFSSSRDSQVCDLDTGRACSTAAARGCYYNSSAAAVEAGLHVKDPAATAVVASAAALADTADGADGSDAQVVVRRSSKNESHEVLAATDGTTTESSLAGKLSFLQVSDPRSSTGAAGRLSLLFPPHRRNSANSSSSGANMAHLGHLSSCNGAGDEWSLSGGAPSAAGLAAARSVRANAALLRDAEVREDVVGPGAAVAATGDVSAVGGTFRRPDDEVDGIPCSPQKNSDSFQDPNGQGSQCNKTQAGSLQNPGKILGQGEPQQEQQESTKNGRLGYFLGVSDLPPMAEAALQHMSALQAVILEATYLIRSWQQQQLIIELLQQRLTAAVVEVQAGQVQLASLMSELDQIKSTQQQQSDDAVAASAEYQKLQQELESAINELEKVKADKTESQQGSAELQQALEAAAATSAAAAAQQQQLQEQLAALQQQLQQELDARQAQQEQLDSTKAELDRLHAEYTQLQESSGSAVATTAAQLARLQEAHQQLQTEHTKLQAWLADGQAAAATADNQQQQLQQQLQQTRQELASLQIVYAQLQAGYQQQGHNLADVQAKYEALQVEHKQQIDALAEGRNILQTRQQQYEHTVDELTAARHEIRRLAEECEVVKKQQQQLDLQRQQLQGQISHSSEELSSVTQLLSQTQQQLAQANQGQQQLEQQKQQLLNQVSTQGHELSNVSQQLSQAQQQLDQANQGQQQLVHQKQQLEHQKQQLEQQKQHLLNQVSSQGHELSTAAQQLSQLQKQLAQALQQEQQLQQQVLQLEAQNEKALEDQIKLMDVNTSLMRDVKDLKAAAEEAEKQRLSKPSKVCQITAVDAEQQHWTKSRSVQTGEELDPRSKRDVGTPADLSLLSYFFRKIKQKQRGGGGAIVGYDPENAREAAAAAAGAPAAVDRSNKSWTGGPLPGIQLEGKRAASMPGGLTRPPPSRTGGSPFSKKTPEPEPKEGSLDLRPVPWEVKQRVDRRRDRDMRLENESAGGTHGDYDKWDYTRDERDNEIDELKKRLVEQDRKSKDAATKAAEDMRVLTSELQGSKRTAELLQSDNFTLRKEINSLRVAMQAMGMALPPMPDSLAGAPRASTVLRSSIMAARPSIMSAPQGLASLSPAAVYAKEGSAPRSSIFGRPHTTSCSSVAGSTWGTASEGGGLIMAGSTPLPGSSTTVGNSIWGSGSGAGSVSPTNSGPGILVGFSSSGGTTSTPGAAKAGGLDRMPLLSLSGASGTPASGLQASHQVAGQGPLVDGLPGQQCAASPSVTALGNAAAVAPAGRASPSPRGAPGQQLLPTIRSSVVKPG